ncbi:MAG: site-specific integrase [Acidobacteriales bacterium]|nr:site-specific integrase [Terriglobales bacterium]
MGRRIGDAHLESRAKRERIRARNSPYWHWLSDGLHLGYLKTGSGRNSWLAKLHYASANPPRRQYRLGLADDNQDADGTLVLGFHQAEAAARAWALEEIARIRGMVRSGATYTVNQAMAAYTLDYERRGGKYGQQLCSTITAHIAPHLGEVLVEKLTRDQVREWLHTIVQTPARKRRKANSPLRFRPAPATDEERRKRQDTSNRVLSVLKAGLNLAVRDQRVNCGDNAWRFVQAYRGVAQPRMRFLSDDEQRALVDASEGDFKLLVRGDLYSGCRYGEITRLLVGDFNGRSLHVSAQIAKTRKARNIVLNGEARQFFKALCLGRGTAEVMFTYKGRAWNKSEQHRLIIEACKKAGIVPRICFYILRHSTASNWVRAGVPLKHISDQLGNSVMICERHYAHLAVDHRAEIFDKLPGLGLDSSTRQVVEGDDEKREVKAPRSTRIN